jgi:salicylate hydroxylase
MPRILIAGAGIGGMTAALALARAGATVTILEQAPTLEAAGAGIQLSPNATRILDRLGVLGTLSSRAFEPDGVRVRGARAGRSIVFLPLRDAAGQWGSPYLVVLRSDLQEALRAAVSEEQDISLHLDTRLAGFGVTPDGVTATIKQRGVARAIEGDALIGADGIRSTVRARLVGDGDAPRETGRTAWRALVPADAVDPLFHARETGLWLGADAHLVHYPVGGGRWINVVAITRDSPGMEPSDLWSVPGEPAVLKARFGAWHATARSLIAAASSWTGWPLFDREPLTTWNAGPVALLGDAAHPVLPFLAQGSAQAIEDAAALADAFAGTRDISDAMARYSRARQGRAHRVQETSRQLGRIYHLAGPAASARDIGMRLIGGRRLIRRYDWLYGFGLRHA